MEFRQELKQDQRLVMTQAMQNALLVLQMPALDLASWLQSEIEQNPLLESYDSPASATFPSIDNTAIAEQTTLYDLLHKEIQYVFHTEEEFAMAEMIIGNLDHNGHLAFPLKELHEDYKLLEKVLLKIQKVAPPGIAARNVQESLLLQLKNKPPLASRIIAECYDDFLHQRLGSIQKKLKVSEDKIKETMSNVIAKLSPYPGNQYEHSMQQPIVPDAFLRFENEKWIIEINERWMPKFSINAAYASYNDPFVRRHLASGKWLTRMLIRRNKTLSELLKYILSKQSKYLQGTTNCLVPMTMREVAKELSLSESTITRAVSNKYISTPRGILELRKFFTSKLISKTGELISNQTAKDLLLQLISSEDKKHPYSDQVLSELLSKQGIPCARRTMAKYRKELKVETAHQRSRI